MSKPVCRFNKFGFCKYGNHCFRQHENTICENVQCNICECPFRHPRKCKFFQQFHYCKFGNYCKYSHDTSERRKTLKQVDDLKEEVKALKQEILEKVKMINEKDEKLKALVEKENEDLKEIEELRNDRNVTQMLFDDFKDEMRYKYGYDSSAETTEEELCYAEEQNAETNECNHCGFKGKTAGGLKTHIRRKHRDRNKSLWEIQICSRENIRKRICI